MAKRKGSPAYQALAPAGAFRFLPEPGKGRMAHAGGRIIPPEQRKPISPMDRGQAELARAEQPQETISEYENKRASLRKKFDNLVEEEARKARLQRIREIGARQKAEMQRMLQESQTGGKGAEARLNQAMDRLNAAKQVQREAGRAVRTPSLEDPFGAAAGETGRMPTFRGTARAVRPMVPGLVTGIAGGALMDYLIRRAEAAGETPLSRAVRKYGRRQTA